MSEAVTLHGYRHSVYTWMARMTLSATGVDWQDREVDPFGPPEAWDKALHPFQMVPVLDHGGFRLYETAAITRYVDTVFGDGRLSLADAKASARIDQVIGIVDSYAYQPLIRQIFAHAVFRPWASEASDQSVIANGMTVADPVLSALDEIAAEGRVLTGDRLTRADCHLAPVMAYFSASNEGEAALLRAPALQRWWQQIRGHKSLRGTWPDGPVQRP
ncbi:MAG: glutathione S-transferase family protein [Tateyamaria sp.]